MFLHSHENTVINCTCCSVMQAQAGSSLYQKQMSRLVTLPADLHQGPLLQKNLTVQKKKEREKMVKSNKAPLTAPLILTSIVHLQPSGSVILGSLVGYSHLTDCVKGHQQTAVEGRQGGLAEKERLRQKTMLLSVIPCQDEAGPVSHEHCTLC